MSKFLIDNWGGLLIPVLILIVFLISIVRIIIKSKAHQPTLNFMGLIGKILGALVFRDLPNNITGTLPTGHFQKPNFSYDEEEEKKWP